jgi:hypothetical protein
MTWVVLDKNREIKGVLNNLDDLFDDYGLALPWSGTTLYFTCSDRAEVAWEHPLAGTQTYHLEKP